MCQLIPSLFRNLIRIFAFWNLGVGGISIGFAGVVVRVVIVLNMMNIIAAECRRAAIGNDDDSVSVAQGGALLPFVSSGWLTTTTNTTSAAAAEVIVDSLGYVIANEKCGIHAKSQTIRSNNVRS